MDTMTVFELIGKLSSYAPDTEVYLYLGDAADGFDAIDKIEPKDYSPTDGWFYTPAYVETMYDSVCTRDDCRQVVAIIPKNL